MASGRHIIRDTLLSLRLRSLLPGDCFVNTPPPVYPHGNRMTRGLHTGQDPHCTGKTGKNRENRENRENNPKNPCQGKHKELENFAKTQGILLAQVLYSLILKLKNIAILAAIILMVFRSWIHLPS